MRLLMIGDIVGKPGRRAVSKFLPGLRHEYGLNLVVANGENPAGGLGITEDTAHELLDSGVDVITTGNHIWAKRDIIPFLETGELPILRPLNLPPGAPGCGFLVFKEGYGSQFNGASVHGRIGLSFQGNGFPAGENER